MFKPCVVIPVYNHERAVGSVVNGILAQRLPCILVDDGSGPGCAAVLDGLAAATPEQITLLRHSVNRGKGGAVMTAIRSAARAGYSHAVQIDADGQHQPADIPRFLEQSEAKPQALIVGCPKYDETAPSLRLCARYLTHVWVSINTLSRQIKDSMCGFRVYPLPAMIELDRRHKLAERMSFDIEVLVHVATRDKQRIRPQQHSIIDKLIEEALLESKSRWQRFWLVTVPLLKPFIALAIFLSLTTAFADLANVWMLTAGRIVFPVVGTHAYWLAIKGGQYGPAAALSLMLVPVLLATLLVLFRIFDSPEATHA